jgi:parallel beta-helix repeat protein
MKKTAVAALILVCLMALGVTYTQPVRAQSLGLITINSDGSINPPTAPIQRVDNTYTLTNNINNCTIEIQRSNTTVNGAGFTIQGFTELYEGVMITYAGGAGIQLSNVNNVTIENFNIKTFISGIELDDSSNNTITRNAINAPSCIELGYSDGNQIIGNTMTGEQDGIEGVASSYNNIVGNSFDGGAGVDLMRGSAYSNYNTIAQNLFKATNSAVGLVGSFNVISNNSIVGGASGIAINDYNDLIFGNTITGNSQFGIQISQGQSNRVFENYIANNSIGLEIGFRHEYTGAPQSTNNIAYLNDFIGNIENARVDAYPVWSASANYWDNGSSGNYWSDYNGTDANGDGIGDTPYNITVNNLDNYPLMVPLSLVIVNLTPPPLPPLPSPAPSATPSLSPLPSPTSSPSLNPSASPSPSPKPLSNQESFPTIPVAVVSGASMTVVCVGLFCYFKKRTHALKGE